MKLSPQASVKVPTRAEIEAFRGKAIRHTLVDKIAGLIDGEIVCVGGIELVGGRPVLFFDVDDRARAFPVLMHKTALKVVERGFEAGYRVLFAAFDPDDKRAKRWLEALGATQVTPESTVMIWQARE